MSHSGWRKSSHSNSSNGCVEVCTTWRKSSHSDSSNGCVEVGACDTLVHLRDTKQHGTGPVLTLTATQWAAFLTDVLDGRRPDGAVTVTHHSDTWLVRDADAELRFTETEWAAFHAGIADREFDLPLAPVPA